MKKCSKEIGAKLLDEASKSKKEDKKSASKDKKRSMNGKVGMEDNANGDACEEHQGKKGAKKESKKEAKKTEKKEESKSKKRKEVPVKLVPYPIDSVKRIRPTPVPEVRQTASETDSSSEDDGESVDNTEDNETE